MATVAVRFAIQTSIGVLLRSVTMVNRITTKLMSIVVEVRVRRVYSGYSASRRVTVRVRIAMRIVRNAHRNIALITDGTPVKLTWIVVEMMDVHNVGYERIALETRTVRPIIVHQNLGNVYRKIQKNDVGFWNQIRVEMAGGILWNLMWTVAGGCARPVYKVTHAMTRPIVNQGCVTKAHVALSHATMANKTDRKQQSIVEGPLARHV
jgi:hypothetical protein